MATETLFSPCRKWRYTLWREWIGGSGDAMFVGLNPSTADEVSDDPTVRRCISYAKAWGYAGLCMTNIFAFWAYILGGIVKNAGRQLQNQRWKNPA